MTVRAVLKQAATGLTTMVLCFIGRFAIATPICWCIYAWGLSGFSCYRDSSDLCPMVVVLSPILLYFGPLAHEEEDPPNPFVPVLSIALVVTAVWTILALVRRYRRA